MTMTRHVFIAALLSTLMSCAASAMAAPATGTSTDARRMPPPEAGCPKPSGSLLFRHELNGSASVELRHNGVWTFEERGLQTSGCIGGQELRELRKLATKAKAELRNTGFACRGMPRFFYKMKLPAGDIGWALPCSLQQPDESVVTLLATFHRSKRRSRQAFAFPKAPRAQGTCQKGGGGSVVFLRIADPTSFGTTGPEQLRTLAIRDNGRVLWRRSDKLVDRCLTAAHAAEVQKLAKAAQLELAKPQAKCLRAPGLQVQIDIGTKRLYLPLACKRSVLHRSVRDLLRAVDIGLKSR